MMDENGTPREPTPEEERIHITEADRRNMAAMQDFSDQGLKVLYSHAVREGIARHEASTERGEYTGIEEGIFLTSVTAICTEIKRRMEAGVWGKDEDQEESDED